MTAIFGLLLRGEVGADGRASAARVLPVPAFAGIEGFDEKFNRSFQCPNFKAVCSHYARERRTARWPPGPSDTVSSSWWHDHTSPESLRKSIDSDFCASLRWLDPLPQTSLFVEAIEFGAAEIETRDDSHHFSIVNDRHMSIASIFHQP